MQESLFTTLTNLEHEATAIVDAAKEKANQDSEQVEQHIQHAKQDIMARAKRIASTIHDEETAKVQQEIASFHRETTTSIQRITKIADKNRASAIDAALEILKKDYEI